MRRMTQSMFDDYEELIKRCNVRIDWEANPKTGIVHDEPKTYNDQVKLRWSQEELADFIENRDAYAEYLANKKPDTKYAKVVLAASQTPVEDAATVEEQIKLICKAELELEKWESEFARRMGDESLSSIILPKPSPSVADVRAKYPEAAAELDARRAEDAAEEEERRKERLKDIDEWNL